MAKTATVDIGTLITETPGVYGGRPCLAGTRYPILEIAVHYNAGVKPEELAEDFSLPLEKVYAGYAYYLANKQKIDDEIEEERAEYLAEKAAAQPFQRLNP